MTKVPELFLRSMRLQNFATFENQEIIFSNSFNAIVGETGSGKSLILDALQLILGGRADKKSIRNSAEFASVEATFGRTGQDKEIKAFFNEIGHPYEEEIIVKRIIYRDNNSSKAFLNHSSCALSTLQQFSRRFIDLVGQFENQKLLSDEYQLQLLDLFARTGTQLTAYRQLFSRMQNLSSQIEELREANKNKEELRDYLKFQLTEINNVNPSSEDEKELIKLKAQIQEAEKRGEVTAAILDSLSNGENAIIVQLGQIINLVKKHPAFFEDNWMAKVYEANTTLEDISYQLSAQDSDFESENISLEEIMDRLDKYQKLKRKYGVEIEAVLAKRDALALQLNEIDEFDIKITKLSAELESVTSAASKMAQELHQLRMVHAKKLSSELTKNLGELRMAGASVNLQVELLPKLNINGSSVINFLAETNPGEGFYKIKDIASGGELSRILLSLRQILSAVDSISVFLFDEIDTGIGGETALCIGRSLQKVSSSSQVIAITHLPQIAFYAEKIIQVEKRQLMHSGGSRTISQVKEFVGQEREVAIKAMNPLQ